MKKGFRTILPVKVETDLKQVQRIRFVFVQGTKRLLFEYPSAKARLEPGLEPIIDLEWSKEDTWMFQANEPINMDTYVEPKAGGYPPETQMVTLRMSDTLFRKEEITNG